jgi:acetolactate synthase-1/2/3 large subunit
LNRTKYSDQLIDWLAELNYTHCFFVGGGNVMHLLESARTRLTCIPVVHEVAAGIAAEYFNATNLKGQKAFALVTAGPGVTNIITALGAAWLESRELLVIAGQAKTTNLSRGTVRQIGHQEIDGKSLAAPFTKESLLLDKQINKNKFVELVNESGIDRKGPVFIEICIDISASPFEQVRKESINPIKELTSKKYDLELKQIRNLILESKRPVFLLGGGLDRLVAWNLTEKLKRIGIPIACTWNGIDRFSLVEEISMGRPNTYGMRSANILIQQSDLVIALGTRLGLQQTGFAWEEFVPNGRIIQIDIDKAELEKGHPKIFMGVEADVNVVFPEIITSILNETLEIQDWRNHIKYVKEQIKLKDPANVAGENFIEAYDFINELSNELNNEDVVIPCSSGGAYTTMMSAFVNKPNQIIVTNKGLASMGYGLSGSIGAAISNPTRRCVLVEGDGGFAQNLQELGTVKVQNLNLKIFIFSNDGYASIRTMQKAYFNGNYIGCDNSTGVGLPDWETIFAAYKIPVTTLNRSEMFNTREVIELMNIDGPAGFIVPIDPEQTYLPKITSKLNSDGSMSSNPLHMMHPPLDKQLEADVLRFIVD